MAEPTEQVEDSILHDIKQLVGQEWDDTTYDLDIKTAINTAFLDLAQIGVGPEDGFEILDHTTKWDEYTHNDKMLNGVKSFIHIKTRLLFDPPTNGFLVTSLNEQLAKLEWRLMVYMDPPINQGVNND